MIIKYNYPDDPSDGTGSSSGGKSTEESDENHGTLILDATCAPQNIAYPQDINLLNEARENLETIIDTVCYDYNAEKPRTYRVNARKDYLALAKRRRRSGEAIRKAIKKQLQYVKRDLGYIDVYLAEGKTVSEKRLERLRIIRIVYEQQ